MRCAQLRSVRGLVVQCLTVWARTSISQVKWPMYVPILSFLIAFHVYVLDGPSVACPCHVTLMILSREFFLADPRAVQHQVLAAVAAGRYVVLCESPRS